LKNKPRLCISREVARLTEDVREENSILLVSCQMAKVGGRRILRVIIDKEGGVTLSDCEAVSRRLSRALDEEELIKGGYCLEVSSPGIS